MISACTCPLFVQNLTCPDADRNSGDDNLHAHNLEDPTSGCLASVSVLIHFISSYVSISLWVVISCLVKYAIMVLLIQRQQSISLNVLLGCFS